MTSTETFNSVDSGGRIYDRLHFFLEYIPFVVRTDIRFVNPWECREALSRQYEMVASFIPARGDVVFDVGAQFADYALIWAKMYGANVVAFEPVPENARTAQHNVELNGVKKITLYTLALAHAKCKIRGNVKSSMLRRESGSVELQADAESLDNFCAQHNVDRIALLKIDVEGFEYEVLSGSEQTLQRFTPNLIIETHSRQLRKECDELLTAWGYVLINAGKIRKGSGWMDEIQNRYYAPAQCEGALHLQHALH